MAELAVGGAFLSAFLQVLFDRMAPKEVFKFFQGEKAILKLLKELKVRLISADELLNDAEEKQLRNPNVKEWLEELKDVIYHFDHVVDKISTEALRCQIEGESTTTKCLTFLTDNDVKGELEEILERLQLLLEQSNRLGLSNEVKRRPTVARSLSPLVEESDVYGREAEKKSLIELLLSDDVTRPKISVIPIVGMGGIGKTTLAQVVYNDTRVQSHFELKVWVTVSEEFDVRRLTKEIFESITGKKCDFENQHQIQSELKEALRGKKFLLVHDDVWNEEYELWDVLRSSFQSGAHGSKIIVTTRSQIVASQMGNVDDSYVLQEISSDDCWKLFTRHVFNNDNSDRHSDLKRIGIDVVKKCKGLPLAVKSIAGLLRSMMSPEAWRGVLESDIWELDSRGVNITKILPSLWLSYSFLPPHLKRCFAFLSTFPKDYEFWESDQKKIILMWMAEGLLPTQNNRRVEDVGEECLEALISRSFFQQSTRWYRQSLLTMHDLIHDLALFVSSGLRSSSSKTRYLSLQEGSVIKNQEEMPVDTTFLRTLILTTYLLESTVLRDVLSRGGCLRALSLFRASITELPDSIGSLKHLRYLDLSVTEFEDLPSSLCSLYNLQTLLLTACQKLKRLPTDMSGLINLRHLDIEGTSFNEMPPQMCNMKDLQVLSNYVVSEKHGSWVKDLGELQLLRGSFDLKGLQNVITVEDALGAKMENKRYLHKIRFKWDSSRDEDPEKETEVLNAFEPHMGLRKIEIEGFGGTKFPNWVGKQSFSEMVEVYLIDCRNCRSLPPFGQLPSLRVLWIIGGMKEVVSIGDEFCGTTLNPFPSLESLFITDMPSWEKWSFSGVEQQGVALFPCLKRLDIDSCNKLNVGLPVGNLPALESIDISYCDTMGSVFPIGTSYYSSSLTKIEVRHCKSLESFSGMGLPSTLTDLNVWDCRRLMFNRLSWGLQRLSSLQSLSLINDLEDDSFPEEGLLPSGLKQISISGCISLEGLSDKGFQNLTALDELFIKDCEQLQRLPAEGLPFSLKNLEIIRCPLLKEQCQRGTGQYWPKIQHIPKIRIN